MTDTEKAALCARIDELCAENERLRGQGEQLFDKTLELGTENAKLREQLEYALQTSRARLETIDRHEAENEKLRAARDTWQENDAKLRELANGYEALTATLCNERECDGCPFDDTEQIVCEHMRLQTCLSEIGIEVPQSE